MKMALLTSHQIKSQYFVSSQFNNIEDDSFGNFSYSSNSNVYKVCSVCNDGDLQTKKQLETTDNPTLHIYSGNLSRKTKFKLIKLFYKIIPNVKTVFRNICKECRKFIVEVYRSLKESTKFPYSKNFFLSLSLSNFDNIVDEKLLLIWRVLSFVLYKALTSLLLNPVIEKELLNTNSNIKLCICPQLHASNQLFLQSYSSFLKIYGPLENCNSYDLFYLFLKINNPSPNKTLNSVFTSNAFITKFDSCNLYRFSSFLNLISYNLITARDLVIFCRNVVKLVYEISKPTQKWLSQRKEYTYGADINLYCSLIPGLFFYITDIIKLQNELMQIFPLIWNMSVNKRLSHFIRNFFALFDISLKKLYQNDLSNPLCVFNKKFKKIKSNVQLKNDRRTKINYPLVQVSTGKEEVEFIDGINFISFESESDMFEFTKKEKIYFHKRRKVRKYRFIKKSCEGRIIPTKTHDITKIKGWRNKLFITDIKNFSKYGKKVFYSKNSKCNVVKNDIKASNVKVMPLINDNIVEDFPKDYYNPEMVEQNRLLMKEFPNLIPNIWDICYKEKYSHILKNINNIYLQSLETDAFHKKIKDKLAVMDNEEGVFQCSLTDEFLEKYADINVSFDIPQLNKWDDSKLDCALQSLANPKKTVTVDNDYTEQKAGINLDFGKASDFVKKIGPCSQQANKLKKKFILIRGSPVFLDYETSNKNTELVSEKKLRLSDLSNTSSSDLEDSIESTKHYKSEYTSPKKTLYFKSSYRDVSPISDSPRGSNLLDTCKSEDTDGLVFNFNSCLAGLNKFLFILPCSAQSNDHSSCLNIISKNMYLGMVLNIGHKRPLNKEVIKNIELLREDPEIIDERWANIAASAFHQVNHKSTVKRVFVPVVSKPLIKLAKFSVENAYDIETDVKNVVNDIVDYVVRKETIDSLDFSYDPDVHLTPFPENEKPLLKKYKKSRVERELGRLINVTLVEENKTDSNSFGESECVKKYCLKGCVCHSLNENSSIFHCGKEQCMFKCLCNNKNYPSPNDIIMHHAHKNNLAKEESLWHKTVICKRNDVIIQGETGKTKRESKLPTRFRNNVLIGKDMNRLDLSPQSISNWRNFKPVTITPKQCSKSIKLPNKKGDQKTSPKLELKDSKNSSPDSLKEANHIPNPSSTVKIKKEPYHIPNPSSTVKIKKEPYHIPNPSSTVKIKKEPYQKPITSNTAKKSLYHMPYPSSNTAKKSLYHMPYPSSNTAKKSLYHMPYPSSNPDQKSSNSVKKMPDLLKVPQISSMNSSVKINSSKEPLKDMMNVKKEIPDNNESNEFIDDVCPPDWELEALLEMEEVDVSSDEETEESDEEYSRITDPYIWCTIHTEYNCQCKNSIFFLKNNILCQNKSLYNKQISRKLMSQALSTTYNFSLAHIHDRTIHSARTYGLQFDFHSRNYSVGFKNKRDIEEKNGILSNTNSLFKLNARKLRNFGKKIDKKRCDNDVIDVVDIIEKKKKPDDTIIDAVGREVFFKNIKMNKVSFDLKCYNKKEGTNHLDSALTEAVTDFEKENETTKVKKKYRIGPAHFEATGNYRSIVTSKYKTITHTSKRSMLPAERLDVAVTPEEGKAISSTSDVGVSHVMAAGVCLPEVNKSVQECKTEDIVKENSAKEDIVKKVTVKEVTVKDLHQYGLLCLTDGFGYLPVQCFTPIKISVRDPLAEDIYHTFKDINAANVWLNRFFKSKMLFEDLNYNLKWVLIKPYLMVKMKVFDKKLIEFNTKVVNKNGILMDKDIFTANYLRLSMETLPQAYRSKSYALERADPTYKMVLESELVAEALLNRHKIVLPTTSKIAPVFPLILKRPDIRSRRVDNKNSLNSEATPPKKIKLDSSVNRSKCVTGNLPTSQSSQIIIEPTDLEIAKTKGCAALCKKNPTIYIQRRP